MASVLSLQEENQLLQQELSRVEDLLAQSRAERDELAIKYNAVSERVGAAWGPRAGPRRSPDMRAGRQPGRAWALGLESGWTGDRLWPCQHEWPRANHCDLRVRFLSWGCQNDVGLGGADEATE